MYETNISEPNPNPKPIKTTLHLAPSQSGQIKNEWQLSRCKTHQQNRSSPQAEAEIEAAVPSQGARSLERQRRPRHVHVAVAEERRVKEFSSGERSATARDQGREGLTRTRYKTRVLTVYEADSLIPVLQQKQTQLLCT